MQLRHFGFLLAILLVVGLVYTRVSTAYYCSYDDHIEIKTAVQTIRQEWSRYRSYYADKNGVLLSPFARPTRLENFRGKFIRFAGNRDRVMDIVRSKIDFEEEP